MAWGLFAARTLGLAESRPAPPLPTCLRSANLAYLPSGSCHVTSLEGGTGERGRAKAHR